MGASSTPRTVCLVACTSRKYAYPASAEFIYRSPLFSAARHYAKSRCDQWFILSAKHGLLLPRDVIEPYDQTLLRMGEAERKEWALSVYSSLREQVPKASRIVFLSGKVYRQFLSPLLESASYETAAPLSSLGIGSQVEWLQRLVSQASRLQHIDRMYHLLERIQQTEVGQRCGLSKATSVSVQARRGVYFFFEAGERRMTAPFQSRVTRIGTHAVSVGSKSTLWNRLRAHRGGSDGVGNHRGSIFRLHVGESIIRRSELQSAFATWGQGQSAGPEVRESEQEIELEVSAVIGTMEITWLAVGDDPSADSDRAYLERNLIALLAGRQGPLDLPSPNWLGHWSGREAIRSSGLWNVNHVYGAFDPSSLDVLERYVEAAEGVRPPIAERIAPRNWRTKPQINNVLTDQIDLF